MNILRKLNKRLQSGEQGGIFKGILTLLIGSGLARIISIGSIPFLTRIYTPEDYAVLALYISFTAIFSQILTLRYVQALPLPRHDLAAFNLFSLCAKLIALGSGLLAIVLWLIGEELLAFFSMGALYKWWQLIVLGSAGAAFYELFSLWATRKRQYKAMAKSQLNQSIISSATKIVLGLLAFKPIGLMVGQMLSQSAGIANLYRSVQNDYLLYSKKICTEKQLFMGRYYQGFVWFRLPSQILMVVSVQAPVLMMAALYNKEVTGQLSLALMAISLPMGLIGKSVANAFYAEIANINRTDLNNIKEITLMVQRKLFMVGIPIALAIVLLSERLFVIAFGPEWLMAGKYATILAPFLLFQFTSSPLMEVINIIGSQFYFMVLHSCRVIGLILVYLVFQNLEVDSVWFVSIISIYLSIFYLSASLLVLVTLSRAQRKGCK